MPRWGFLAEPLAIQGTTTASLTVASLSWTGGKINIANLTVLGTFALSGTATKFLDTGTFTTSGSVTLSGTGGFTFLNNSTWNDSGRHAQ